MLQVLPGGADVGEAMVTHPLVRVISFTGSTAAGRRVGELAGKHLKRAHLELGGNSALIVLDDADVDEAVNLAAFGSFFHQGQICMTTGRHLVHERLYDDFVERLAAKAAHLPVGDPRRQRGRARPADRRRPARQGPRLVTASVDAGREARRRRHYDQLFYSGHRARRRAADRAGLRGGDLRAGRSGAALLRPWTRPSRSRRPASTGCRSGIVTRDVMRGLALADRIPTGIVHINDQTVNDEANSPFGGVGASGTGSRFGGAAANIDAFTETRWVTMRSQPPTYPF